MSLDDFDWEEGVRVRFSLGKLRDQLRLNGDFPCEAIYCSGSRPEVGVKIYMSSIGDFLMKKINPHNFIFRVEETKFRNPTVYLTQLTFE